MSNGNGMENHKAAVSRGDRMPTFTFKTEDVSRAGRMWRREGTDA